MFRRILAAAFALALLAPVSALAAPPPNITQTVGVCDPNYPKRCIAVAVDGSIAVTGGGGGGGSSTVKATAAAPTYIEGSTANPVSADLHGSQRILPLTPAGVAVDLSSPSAIIGADGTTIASNTNPLPISDAGGSITVDGTVTANLGTLNGAATAAKQPTLDAAGAAIFPQSGTATRILTATTLTLNTNATVCPTATNPVVTEIFFTTAGVGIGLNGQTLTAAVPGATTTNSPDIAIAAANTLYTAPVGISNAVTAYGAAGVVRCIQTLRQ